MRKMLSKKINNGFGMLEVVVGVSIIAFAIFSLFLVAQISLRVSEESSENVKAAFLLEEGVEAVKLMRDMSWQNIGNLTVSTDYFFTFNGASWATTTTNVYVDGFFERKFTLENVYRDANQDIVSSGGVLDTDTRKLNVFVSWNSRTGTTTKTISTYVANLFN